MNSIKVKEASEYYNRMFDPQKKLEQDHRNQMEIWEATWLALSSLEYEHDQLKKRVDDLESANR